MLRFSDPESESTQVASFRGGLDPEEGEKLNKTLILGSVPLPLKTIVRFGGTQCSGASCEFPQVHVLLISDRKWKVTCIHLVVGLVYFTDPGRGSRVVSATLILWEVVTSHITLRLPACHM